MRMTRMIVVYLAIVLTSCFYLTTEARIIRWIPSGGGSLHNSGNWEGGAVPNDKDDAVIQVQNLEGVRPFAERSENDLTKIDAYTLITMAEEFRVHSLKLSGQLTLLVDNTLKAGSEILLGSQAAVRIRGGTIEAPLITTEGLIALELGQIQRTELSIQESAMLYLSGEGGANSVISSTLTVFGVLFHADGPLILDNTEIDIEEGGVFRDEAESILNGNSDSPSSIHVRSNGMLQFDSRLLKMAPPEQVLMIPLEISNNGRMEVKSNIRARSSLVIYGDFHCNGEIRIYGRRTLRIAGGETEIKPAGIIFVDDESIFHAHAGKINIAGEIQTSNCGGQLLVTTPIQVSNSIFVKEILIREGVVKLVDTGLISVQRLNWISGTIVGNGKITLQQRCPESMEKSDVLQSIIVGNSGLATLAGALLEVSSILIFDTDSILMIKDNAQIMVLDEGTLNASAHSTIMAEDTSKLFLSEGSSWNIMTSGSQDGRLTEDDRTLTSFLVEIESQGEMKVYGNGEALFSRGGYFTKLSTFDDANIRFKGDSLDTTYTVNDPLNLRINGSLTIDTATIELLSSEPSQAAKIELLGATMIVDGPLFTNVLVVGSATTSSSLTGMGPIHVKKFYFRGGTIDVDFIRVEDQLIVLSNNYKVMAPKNLTILSNGVGDIFAPNLAVGVDTYWIVETNGTLRIHEDVQIYCPDRNNTASTPEIDIPILLDIRGKLIFNAQGTGQSELRIGTAIQGELETQNDANTGVFVVLLSGGIVAESNSNFSIGSDTELVLECPENFNDIMKCTYGRFVGNGQLTFSIGEHTVTSSSNITSLTRFANTIARLLAPIQSTETTVEEGAELTLYRQLDTSRLNIYGGRIIGFPIMASAIQILPYGKAIIMNDTPLFLQGLAVRVNGELLWKGDDIYLSDDASVIITSQGKLLIETSARIAQQSCSMSYIENFGKMKFGTNGSAFLSLNILNHGTIDIGVHNTVTFEAEFIQSGRTSVLQVDSTSELIKEKSSLVILEGTIDLSGILTGNLNLGGMLSSDVVDSAYINGELILSPTAILTHPTFVNKTTILNGELRLESQYENTIIVAGRIFGRFEIVPSSARIEYAPTSVKLIPYSSTKLNTDEQREKIKILNALLHENMWLIQSRETEPVVKEVYRTGSCKPNETSTAQSLNTCAFGLSSDTTKAALIATIIATILFGILAGGLLIWFYKNHRTPTMSNPKLAGRTNPLVSSNSEYSNPNNFSVAPTSIVDEHKSVDGQAHAAALNRQTALLA